jgi:hypothetical protein
MDLHLTKPVSVDELRQFLQRYRSVHGAGPQTKDG